MENITLGTIATCLTFIISFISSVEIISKKIKKIINEQIKPSITEEIMPLKEELLQLKEKVCNLKDEQDINERDRIRYEILQFSGSLRNGLERTENDYKHIEELFEKYDKKGWNSYIHSEMEFIRNKRNQLTIKK